MNDFINTTLGGIALGEMFHRTAWLVRDTRATGRGRMWKEIGATALDPVTGLNRFRTGDAKRLTDKPADMVPSTLAGFTSAGVLWRGSQTRAFDATGQPFLEVDLMYGDPRTGRSRTPYDAFSVRLRFGGGAAFSEARVRGRLMGQPLGRKGAVHRHAELRLSEERRLRHRGTVLRGGGRHDAGAVGAEQMSGHGMGRADRARRDRFPSARRHRESAGGGEGARGRAGGLGGAALLRLRPGRDLRRARALLPRSPPVRGVLYEGRHIYSLDGVRANHFLQRARLDLLVPVRGPLGLGVSGEYFFRQSFYQDEDRTQLEYRYPQFRAYLTWSFE